MKVIGKAEKGFVYAFAITVDIIQIILDIFVVSEIANHIIDIIVGVMILGYGAFRKLWTPKKGLTLLAYFIGEQIPFVNALPFWTLDIKNLYSGVFSSQEELEAANQQNQTGPLNHEAGIRYPRKPLILNNNQTRRPNNITQLQQPVDDEDISMAA